MDQTVFFNQSESSATRVSPRKGPFTVGGSRIPSRLLTLSHAGNPMTCLPQTPSNAWQRVVNSQSHLAYYSGRAALAPSANPQTYRASFFSSVHQAEPQRQSQARAAPSRQREAATRGEKDSRQVECATGGDSRRGSVSKSHNSVVAPRGLSKAGAPQGTRDRGASSAPQAADCGVTAINSARGIWPMRDLRTGTSDMAQRGQRSRRGWEVLPTTDTPARPERTQVLDPPRKPLLKDEMGRKKALAGGGKRKRKMAAETQGHPGTSLAKRPCSHLTLQMLESVQVIQRLGKKEEVGQSQATAYCDPKSSAPAGARRKLLEESCAPRIAAQGSYAGTSESRPRSQDVQRKQESEASLPEDRGALASAKKLPEGWPVQNQGDKVRADNMAPVKSCKRLKEINMFRESDESLREQAMRLKLRKTNTVSSHWVRTTPGKSSCRPEGYSGSSSQMEISIPIPVHLRSQSEEKKRKASVQRELQARVIGLARNVLAEREGWKTLYGKQDQKLWSEVANR